jgi:hypothetical protein
MKKKNTDLVLTRDELLNMITADNTDKTDWSKDILVKMIKSFKSFSDKQYKWVFSKVKYIVKHNSKYKNFRDIKGFVLEN